MDRRRDKSGDHQGRSSGRHESQAADGAFSLYATMTDQDHGAIVAYLRTVPPQE